MSKILDEFVTLFRSRPNYQARGWTNIDCPACSDNRKRLGLLLTDSGGFRIKCFNGGCELNDTATGWEPGNGLTGRVRTVFETLGGSVRDIPLTELLTQNRNVYDRRGNVVGRDEPLEVATRFPDVEMPPGTDFLDDAAERHEDARDVLDYLRERSPIYLDLDFPWMWSPRHPRYLLVPYLHHKDRIVGYMGRCIDRSDGKGRFLQRAPADFLFQQYLLPKGSGKEVFVLESPMDAIPLQGVATRTNSPTVKQVNLLKLCGREPIMIPDMVQGEANRYLSIAEENNWYVSVPDWAGRLKDVGEAVQKYGLLWTIETITTAKTKNYTTARIRLGVKG